MTTNNLLKVLNIWGGPGVGKSTTAAGLFYEMKKAKLNVELVTEYAKDAVWERRYDLLDDQIYIFAKQHRRITRLNGHGIDWVITDSPLPLGLIYMREDMPAKSFPSTVMEVFSTYKNYNFLLQRHWEYNPVGRNQKDVEEAKVFDAKVVKLFETWKMPVQVITGGEVAVDTIMRDVVLAKKD